MSLQDVDVLLFSKSHPYALAFGLVSAAVVLWHVVPYLLDPHGLRKYPGPFLARFTDFWMFYVAGSPDRSETIDKLHKKYGPFVRIAPNHVSIASTEALHVVYGHTSKAMKSQFYDAFVSTSKRGLFNSRDRAEHTRKRRILAHMFSAASVRSFEERVRGHLDILITQWDLMCSKTDGKQQKGDLGNTVWQVEGKRVWFNGDSWCKFFTWDVIGELAFGLDFNMLPRAKDTVLMAKAARAGMQSFALPSDGKSTIPEHYQVEEISAINTINTRTELVSPLACLPSGVRAVVRRMPVYSGDLSALKRILGMAVNAILQRLEAQRQAEATGNSDRSFDDMFGRLLNGKDEDGNPMSPDELTAEAITLLIAGSDTTSNSVSALLYYLGRDPERQRKLQAELDSVSSPDTRTFGFDEVKGLPYLEAVINEGLRLFSTLGAGLPRLAPAGGLTVHGQTLPEGTEVSVPSYSLHHSEDIWGPDVKEFIPERWLNTQKKSELTKSFAPFSIGPRACIGRNIALLEMTLFTAAVFHRFDVVVKEGQQLKIIDGFLRKPDSNLIGVRRRFN